jgi:Peptidase_C39 like family
VKTNVRRWLPAIVHNGTRSALLGLAALAAVGGAVALGATQAGSATVAGSPVTTVASADKSALVKAADQATSASDPAAAQRAAQQAAAAKAAADKAAADKAAADKAAAAKAAAQKPAPQPPAEWWLTNTDVQMQPNYYYCGPAAVRNALTAHGKALSMDDMANLMGTTTNGTDSAFDITKAMNKVLGGDRYHTAEIPGQRATPQQMDKLQADIVEAVSHGDAVVANVAGTVTDTGGAVHSYEGGHYLTVIGYGDHGRIVAIGDSASPDKPTYKLSTIDLANWIASRGYSY